MRPVNALYVSTGCEWNGATHALLIRRQRGSGSPVRASPRPAEVHLRLLLVHDAVRQHVGNAVAEKMRMRTLPSASAHGDANAAVLREHGFTPVAWTSAALRPRLCRGCGELNVPTVRRCANCDGTFAKRARSSHWRTMDAGEP